MLSFLFIGASPVMAHNSQESSSPGESATLSESPPLWVVAFAKPVPLDSASGEVINGDGVRTDLGRPRYEKNESTIAFDLPAGLIGSITLRWRLVGVDGHIIAGRVRFLVQLRVAVATTPSVPESLIPDPVVATPLVQPETFSNPIVVPESLRFGLRLWNYIGTILLGGILTGELLLAKGMLTLLLARRLARIGLFAMATAPILQLLIFINDVRGPAASWLSGFTDIFASTPGSMLFIKSVVGCLLVVVLEPSLRLSRLNIDAQRFSAVVVTMYLLTLSYGGHSRSQSIPWLGIPVGIAHIAAVAVWVGGLVAMTVVIVPNVSVDSAVAAFRRFGYVAERAVVVIVVTGLIQSVRLHQTPASLFSSSHGILLTFKVILVIVMLRLAARNRVHLARRVEGSTVGAERLRGILIRAALWEFVMGIVVVGVTAAMVSSSLT